MVFFLDLPTEILSRILFYLSAVDLCIAQRICHHINKIITDTAGLQYIIRTHINSVDDILPPDCSFHDRLDLLKRYEKSWNNLQLDKSAEFTINTETPPGVSKQYTLQDGYLICETFQEPGPPSRYGYLDLYAATRNKEASWVRIQIQDPDDIKRHLDPPLTSVVNNELDRDPLYAAEHELDLMFSVDYDLVVAISILQLLEPSGRYLPVLAFFEFTTGAPHPLASKHVVWLSESQSLSIPSIEIDFLGDYILVSQQELPDSNDYPLDQPIPRTLRLVSWKTGDVTYLRESVDDFELVSGMTHKPLVIDSDDNLIALADCPRNRLEICKLVFQSHRPHLQTLCFLELPPLKPNNHCIIFWAEKEWVSTLQNQTFSSSSRRRLGPFRSCKIGTLSLSLTYTPFNTQHRHGMIVNVAALLLAARSSCGDARTIPWVIWGPPATHIFPLWLNPDGTPRQMRITPAGPFWIMQDTQLRLVIQDYDWLRNWHMQAAVEDTSSLSRPSFTAAKAIGQHWVAGELETHLPHRDVVIIENRDWSTYGARSLIDREWFVGLSFGPGKHHVVVYHIG